MIHRGFDPARVVEALQHDRIALTTLVPAMIQACLAVPGVDDHDYPDLQSIAYGGSAIAEPVLRRAMEVFGCDFYQGFGQTESSAGLTYLTETDHRVALAGRPELLASCGRPLPGTEIRIVDDDGAPRAGRDDRRDRGPRPPAHGRLLEPARRDRGDPGRRLAPHRRPRVRRRRRATSRCATAGPT